jgi:hypothetical protein
MTWDDIEIRGTYCGTFVTDDITSRFSEFLGYSMPRKVIAGNATMRAVGGVVARTKKSWRLVEVWNISP